MRKDCNNYLKNNKYLYKRNFHCSYLNNNILLNKQNAMKISKTYKSGSMQCRRQLVNELS